MVSSDYTIEVYRAVFEQLLREANNARLVNQLRRGSATQLIGALMRKAGHSDKAICSLGEIPVEALISQRIER